MPGLEGALFRPVYSALDIKAQRGTKLGHLERESYKKGKGSNKKGTFWTIEHTERLDLRF